MTKGYEWALLAFGLTWILIAFVALHDRGFAGLCGTAGCDWSAMAVFVVVASLPIAAAIGIVWTIIHFIRKRW